MIDFGADHPFQQVQGKLQEHYGITLPHETIRQVTERVYGAPLVGIRPRPESIYTIAPVRQVLVEKPLFTP